MQMKENPRSSNSSSSQSSSSREPIRKFVCGSEEREKRAHEQDDIRLGDLLQQQHGVLKDFGKGRELMDRIRISDGNRRRQRRLARHALRQRRPPLSRSHTAFNGWQLFLSLPGSALPPLLPNPMRPVQETMRPAFRPLEFAGQQKQPEGNEDEGRAGRENHDDPSDETEAADEAHEDFPQRLGNVIHPEEMPHLAQRLAMIVFRHVGPKCGCPARSASEVDPEQGRRRRACLAKDAKGKKEEEGNFGTGYPLDL